MLRVGEHALDRLALVGVQEALDSPLLERSATVTGYPRARHSTSRHPFLTRRRLGGQFGGTATDSAPTLPRLRRPAAWSARRGTLAGALVPWSASPVHVVNFDRYRLRLHLERPLLGVPEQRRHRAFDQYTAELVRDDGTVCAAAEVYFVRIDDARADHARAAAAIGSEFLVKVCSEALDWRGAVLEDIEAEFMDAMTDVFVLERIDILDPDADKPVLRGMFVQALFNTLSRGMDIVFIHADPAELPFWRDTVGARQVGDFIAASGARRLPVYPKPPRPVPARGKPPGPPRLRVVGKPRQPN